MHAQLSKIEYSNGSPSSLHSAAGSGPNGLNQIWQTNSQVPEFIEACVHALFKRNVLDHPDAIAIQSWDGQLSYRQLDQQSSRLAQRLVDIGVTIQDKIAISFEKSVVAPVAILGTIKAGATCVVLDVSQSSDNTKDVIKQTSPILYISSAKYESRIHSLTSNAAVLVLDEAFGVPKMVQGNHNPIIHRPLPICTPSDSLCHIASSAHEKEGPVKGAAISHREFSSLVLYRKESLGINSSSRIFDAARPGSYISWCNILFALICGARLCIPSDDEYLDNAEAVLLNSGANFVLSQLDTNFLSSGITSLDESVIEWTFSEGLDILKKLVISGTIQTRHKDLYRRRDSISVHDDITPPSSPDASNNSTPPNERVFKYPNQQDAKDMALELVVGPDSGVCAWIVDQSDPQTLVSIGDVGELCLEGPIMDIGLHKDTSQFITNPDWLLNGTSDWPGRRGRVYKTGILAQYGMTGTIIVVDSSPCLNPTIAEAFKPEPEFEVATSGPILSEATAEAATVLQTHWARILYRDYEGIRLYDDFFDLGAGVPQVVQLELVANNSGIPLTAANIYENPRLCDLARLAAEIKTHPSTSILPFSLIGKESNKEDICTQVAQICRVQESQVVDVLPCTSLQEGLLALTVKQPGAYVAKHKFDIGGSVDLTRLRLAWDKVTAMNPILRTRIVSLPNQGMMQAVLSEGIKWTFTTSSDYKDEVTLMGLGTDLVNFTVVEDVAVGTLSLVWEIHHALYDGWSLGLLLNQAEQTYFGQSTASPQTMAPFIQYLGSIDDANTKRFWESQFAGIGGTTFPLGRPGTTMCQPDHEIHVDINAIEWGLGEFTASTIVRGAWAAILANCAGSDEALFGATVTGRQAPVPYIEDISGPTIATVPIRVAIDWNWSVKRFLETLQAQSTDMIPFEQTGLQNIRKISDDALVGCDFQSLLVVQPANANSVEESENIFLSEQKGKDSDTDWQDFSTYPIVVECQLEASGAHLRIAFDSTIVSRLEMDNITANFQNILTQLSNPEIFDQNVGSLCAQSLQPFGLADIWGWNAEVPPMTESCVHHLIDKYVIEQPEAPAVCSWDGNLTYKQLDNLSSRLAGQLIERNVAGTVVPVVFEKSMWMPVAAVAVMKAGAATVALDMKQPEDRLKSVISQANGSTILSSVNCEAVAKRLVSYDPIVVGRPEQFQQSKQVVLPEVKPSDLLYVVFTSGSTGTPKGAMVSHGNFCTAITYQQDRLGFTNESRVFDFSSYAFDAAWCNLLHALTKGGCLCIPSQSERDNDLGGALTKYKATTVDFTPSVARMLGPAVLSQLKTLILGGEAVLPGDVSLAGPNTEIINVYGPAECTPTTTLQTISHDHSSNPSPGSIAESQTITIGKGAGACTWVVNVNNPDMLAPLGAVGELWVEGPLVGLGYVSNAEKTKTAFLNDPSWLLAGGGPGYPGREGRVYRTGDLVRYTEDGNLVYVGRKDTQVKIRGQRVELGEVEYHVQQALLSTKAPGLVSVQVVAETIQPSGKQIVLVAFVSLDFETEISESEQSHSQEVQRLTKGIEKALDEILPVYMIPSAYIPLANIPMSPTGKTDRKQLKSIGQNIWSQYRSTEDVEPEQILTETERVLQQVWMSVLNLTIIEASVNKAFTRIGGDSITAMQVVSQCRLRNIGITVTDVLQGSTIRKIALRCKDLANTIIIDDTDENPQEAFDLSPIQQLFFDVYPEGLQHFNQSFLLELGRVIPMDTLSAAIFELVNRHGMLRARFYKDTETKKWRQKVLEDASGNYGYSERFVANPSLIVDAAQWRQEHLDITEGPVFACDVFTLPNGVQTIALSAHHLVVDLVSWRVVWNDIEEFVNTGKLLSQPNTTSFKKWVNRQAKASRNASPMDVLPYTIPLPDLDFWGLPLEENLFGNTEAYTEIFNPEITGMLFGDSNESLHTEPVDIILASMVHAFLETFQERAPPVFWLEGHGREPDSGLPLDVSETVGWFTTMYPVPVNIQSGDSIIEAIRRAKDTRHRVPGKGRPFFSCKYNSEAGREIFSGHDIVEVIFNFTGRFQQLEGEEGLFKRPEPLEDDDKHLMEVSDAAKRLTMIEINADVEDDCLAVTFQVHKKMKYQDRFERWSETFAKTLESVTKQLIQQSPGFTLSDLPLLPLSYPSLDRLIDDMLPNINISPQQIADIYPCSPLQEGILISAEKEIATYATFSIWNCLSTTTPGSNVDPIQLEAAWRTVSARHSILSTVFSLHPEGTGYVQIALNSPPIRITQLHSGTNDPAEVLATIKRSPFAANEPEHAFTICQSQSRQVACRLDVSHTLIDASSMSVLVQEIICAYDNCLMAPASPFSDMIQYIGTVPRNQRVSAWVSLLKGVEPCEFPTSRPLSESIESHGDVTVASDSVERITAFCRDQGITRSVFLQVAWAMVLSIFTGQHDVCFGYLASGRDAPINGVDGMVGPLANLLISRIDLDSSPEEVLQKTSNTSIQHLSIQHTSLAEIQHKLGVAGKSMFNTSLSIREPDRLKGEDERSIMFQSCEGEDPHEYDLGLSANIDINTMDLVVEYKEQAISRQTAEKVCVVLLNAIDMLLDGSQFSDVPNTLSARFFYTLMGVDEDSATDFWTSQLSKFQGSHFPPLKDVIRPSQRDSSITHTNTTNLSETLDVASDLVRAAWSIVAARNLGTEEAIFGILASDHQSAVPFHVAIDWDSTISVLLDNIRETSTKLVEFDQMCSQRIRLLSSEAAAACDFAVTLDIQKSTVDSAGSTAAEGSSPIGITCQLSDTGVNITANFDHRAIDQQRLTRILQQFEHVLTQLCIFGGDTKIGNISLVSEQDLSDIWSWNATLPKTIQRCMHEWISETATANPNAWAINAWDGNLTYHEMDSLSTAIAHDLISRGIHRGQVVPICFEKSMWTPVAALAVMKTGATVLTLDSATQPEDRMKTIIKQVEAKFLISSEANADLSSRLGLEVMILGPEYRNPINQDNYEMLPSVNPASTLYIVFTSGSTGTPKGAMISHQNFASTVFYQLEAQGIKRTSRMLDFASYAFDVSWSNMLFALSAGGCLCIPSAQERQDNIAACLEKYNVNWAEFTPSVARYIEPRESLSRLATLSMGGEAVLPSDAKLAGPGTQVINGYGPAECTPTSTIADYTETTDRGIGVGVGVCTWVVEPDNPNMLAAIGAVGELWIEGPQVGDGYINDAEKTTAAFFRDPEWLIDGIPGKFSGRHGRAYRTGDLVRYNDDGSLAYLGRKDTQVKIRGQRVELGEVEHHVLTAISMTEAGKRAKVVIETIKPSDSSNIILVAFVVPAADGGTDSEESIPHTVRKLTSGIPAELERSVPPYMIPAAFIPLDEMPMMPTGKADRRKLRAIGGSFSLKDIAALNRTDGVKQAARTKMELRVQKLWAEVLGVDSETISASDNFFKIGGDSIGAMRLVGKALQEGLSMSVREVFRNPVLSDLASFYAAEED